MLRVIIKACRSRGWSFITLCEGGNDARAIAAKVSMIRFTHNICVTVSGLCVPIKAPATTMRHATTFTVSWKSIKRCMFWYKLRPHITARPMDRNELSIMVMSDASFATLVPSPIDRPTCAAFSAGASLVPSPVTATIWLSDCKLSTKRFLSIGFARTIIFKSSTRCFSSSLVSASSSGPVIMFRSVSFGVHNPTCLPISFAVPGVSPVTIFTLIPAFIHSFTAAGTSLRTGSEMATIPRKQKFTSMSVAPFIILPIMPASKLAEVVCGSSR